MESEFENKLNSTNIIDKVSGIIMIICALSIWIAIFGVCLLLIVVVIFKQFEYYIIIFQTRAVNLFCSFLDLKKIYPEKSQELLLFEILIGVYKCNPHYDDKNQTFTYDIYDNKSNKITNYIPMEDFSVISGQGSDICMLGKNHLKENGKLIVFFPGNAYHLIAVLEIIKEYFERYKSDKVCVAAMIYRGMNESLTPSEKNLKNDIQNFKRIIKETNPNTKFIIYGFSIGCAPAIHLASIIKNPQNNYHTLIIQNPFRNLGAAVEGIVEQIIPIPRLIIDLFISDEWDNENKLLLVNDETKIYLFISEYDDLIKPKTNQLVLSNLLSEKRTLFINFMPKIVKTPRNHSRDYSPHNIDMSTDINEIINASIRHNK